MWQNPAPHCTNPSCPYFHHENDQDTSWRRDFGFYSTKAFGTVNRYQCNHCGKTFSDQSFKIDYYVKKPVNYEDLIRPLVSTSGQRNTGRFYGLRYELIQNRYERLSRMLMAVHAQLRKEIGYEEAFVLDGFESFSKSQYYPNNINILVGSESEFIYGMGFSQLRRKGVMTEEQKEERERLETTYGRAPGKAITMSAALLMANAANYLDENNLSKTTLRSDEHLAYVRAYRSLHGLENYFTHERYSSKAPRNDKNPLFAVNYVDRQFRKDQANHVRETVQFARCPSAMMARLSIYQMYHNYMMPKRIKQADKGDWSTRGEFMGLGKERIIEVLLQHWKRRPFFLKTKLWAQEKATWLMKWRNSSIARGMRTPLHIFV